MKSNFTFQPVQETSHYLGLDWMEHSDWNMPGTFGSTFLQIGIANAAMSVQDSAVMAQQMQVHSAGMDDKTSTPLGGIDFNAGNLNLQIKRDGKGIPLPLAQQDMAQLANIQGFVPVILEIKPAVSTRPQLQ